MSPSSGGERRRSAAMRSLLSLSVGDAFGERFFRYEPTSVTLASVEARELPAGPWRWTDDTAQGAALTAHLLEHGRVDPPALALAFAEVYLADPRRGYGAGAHDLLKAIGAGGDYQELARAAFGGTGSMGNGAAMRVAPLGAFFASDLGEVAEQASLSASVSHPNINGVAGAVAVALAAAGVEREMPSNAIWAEILARTPRSHTLEIIEEAAGIEPDSPVREVVDRIGSGSRVCAHDTVPFCLWAALGCRGSLEAALWRTVAGLGDRDTTCAIVAGILGASASVRIPEEWRRRTEVLPL